MTVSPAKPYLELRRLAISAIATTWLATLAGCSTMVQAPEGSATSQPPATQPPIKLSENDVFFHERVFRVGSRYWSGMCGYTIHGNHDSTQVPRPEWAISIDEFMDRDTPVVRVRAVAFEVVSKERDSPRRPRPPIKALTFTLAGEREPLTAHIVGQPSGDNAVEATLETPLAQELLEAFYDAQPIKISLTYQDDATEVLEVHAWADRRKFTGLNGYLHQCLQRLDPVPAGVKEVKYKLVSPGSGYGFGFESPNSNTAPWD
jgi:hypothetical protein